MKSIVLIVPYIGKWPFWFEAHLVSISKNPTVNWLFITDCEIPDTYPENVRFIPTTLDQLNLQINNLFDVEVPLSPRKLCDVRPAYGKLFQEYIQDYDFWGFCDVDIIWGNIRKFVSDEMLSHYDIISSRKEAISGHFTIFKNYKKVNEFYKTIPNFFNLVQLEKYKWVEEQVLTRYLTDKKPDISVCWNTYLVNNKNGKAHQEYYFDKWLWKAGQMFELKKGIEINEFMYLHFINWKRTMKSSEVSYKDKPVQFYISCDKIHYKPHTIFQIQIRNSKNFFNGYWVKDRRRLRKNKFKSFIKRVKRKLKL